jgi:hypothetical protein
VATVDTFIKDAHHKNAAYSGMAHAYAAKHETWLALHAQFAADLAAAQGALLSDGLDPHGLSEVVRSSLDASQMDPAQPYLSALQARDSISRVLPHDTVGQWRVMLAHLGHFENQPPASPDGIATLTRERLDGQDAQSFLVNKRQEQEECRVQAVEAWDAGDVWGAIEGTYGADLACFEAWLVRRSLLIGDDSLIHAELMWTLACAALEKIPAIPEDYDAAVALVRSRLSWTVGPQEAPSLARALDS